MKRVILFSAVSICFLTLAASVSTQTKVRVRFARGATSAVVSGTVRGFAYKDYLVGTAAGQEIGVRLNQNTSSVFTIFQPNGDNLDGATEKDEFNGTLPGPGDYVVRVMMMRADARRPRSISSYTLRISIK